MHNLRPDHRALLDKQLAIVAVLETTGPSGADLAAAPLLDLWQAVIDTSGRPALCGQVTGHPRLDDNAVFTSRLLALDAANGWARTNSRWYRLGQPFAVQLQELVRQIEIRGGAVRCSVVTAFHPPGCRVITDLDDLEPVLARHIAWPSRLC